MSDADRVWLMLTCELVDEGRESDGPAWAD